MTAETTAEETTEGPETAPETGAETEPRKELANQTGDIAAMERALKKANREAETARRKLAERETADLSETEKAIEKARSEGAQGAIGKANERILRAEVKAIAAGKLSDPADAIALLDLSEFSVDEDGEVDAKAVGKAIDALLVDKPYLAAAGGRTTPVVPTGARPGIPSDGDMNALIRQAAGRS